MPNKEKIIENFDRILCNIIENYELELKNIGNPDRIITCDVDDVYNWIEKAKRIYLNKTN